MICKSTYGNKEACKVLRNSQIINKMNCVYKRFDEIIKFKWGIIVLYKLLSLIFLQYVHVYMSNNS